MGCEVQVVRRTVPLPSRRCHGPLPSPRCTPTVGRRTGQRALWGRLGRGGATAGGAPLGTGPSLALCPLLDRAALKTFEGALSVPPPNLASPPLLVCHPPPPPPCPPPLYVTLSVPWPSLGPPPLPGRRSPMGCQPHRCDVPSLAPPLSV